MDELIPTYKFTETFDAVKSVEFSTNDLYELYSRTMEFLKYCGLTQEQLKECAELYEEDFI